MVEEIKSIIQREMAYVISFDPGVSNFGVAILVQCGDKLALKRAWVFNVCSASSRQPDVNKLKSALDVVSAYMAGNLIASLPRQWAMETQPAIGNASVVRANSFVESFVISWLIFGCGANDIMRLSPAAVKRHFDFPVVERGKQYRSNKKSAIILAKKLVAIEEKISDHVADCILNAIYAVEVVANQMKVEK
jgi:hypothetical protein